mgnify:CR=1 FL=1
MAYRWSLSLLLMMGCQTAPEHVRPKVVGDTAGVTPSGDGAVYINEVRSDNAPFVELVNMGDERADMAGWRLLVGTCEHVFSDTAGMAPGTFVALWVGGTFNCPVSPTSDAVLYTAEGQIVDELTWTVPFARHAWCRMPDGSGPPTSCAQSTPGRENSNTSEQSGVEATWIWRFDGKVKSMVPGADNTVWIGQPRQGILSRVGVEDAVTQLEVSMAALPNLPDGRPGWEGLVSWPDGTVAVSDGTTEAIVQVDPTTGGISTWASTADLGRPHDLTRLPDGGVCVSITDDGRVACFNADASLRWMQEGSDTVPLTRPKQLTATDSLLVVLDEEAEKAVALDLLDGSFRGTLSGVASVEREDLEPGTLSQSSRGITWSSEHQVLLLTDSELGRVLGFDTSNVDVLLSADNAWGYIGAVGRFGADDDELGSPHGIMAMPAYDLLLIADDANQRVVAYPLSETISMLER